MKHAGALTGAALASLTLGACMGPRPQLPDESRIASPSQWREGSGDATKDLSAEWWLVFDDPTINELVTQTLAHNDDLAIAMTRVREAEAHVRLARGEQMPSLGLDFLGIGRDRTYSTVTGRGLNFSAYKMDGVIAYDADLFGRLAQQTAAARAALLATKAARDAARLLIVGETLTEYAQLLELDSSRAIARDTLESRRQQLRLLKHQSQEGYVPQISVSEAESALHAVEQQLAQLDLSARQLENALSVLIGNTPSEIPRGRGLQELPLPQAPVALPAQLLRQRPDIYAAEQDIVAADHSLDSARAAFLPDIKLNAGGGRLDADVLPGALQIWSFSTSVLAPIYEGGRLRAGQDLAAAQRDQAAYSYRKAALTAFQEVEDALSACRILGDKEHSAQAERDADVATLQLAKRRFEHGYSSYLEVLDAERSLFAAELTLSQTRAARFSAHVRLFLVVGGGWTQAALD